LHVVLEELSRRGVQQVLVEGGPKVLTSFLREGLADEICVYIAPKILAANGVAYLAEPMAELLTGVDLEHVEVKAFAEDVRISGRPKTT
jgi:diaminohydroxyphosphoribosylaminopyrimidine deaminase/5-amino-6-(5-phosphoribosylamino)uracil reductase